MLSLINERLAQLEAQQCVSYRGAASMYGILERMDRLVYGSGEFKKCIGCDRQTNTIVCFACCAEIICGASEFIVTAFEENELPEEDYDYLSMLKLRDPTDIFLNDVEASVLPFLYAQDYAVPEIETDLILDLCRKIYPKKNQRFRAHVLKFTRSVIQRLQKRKELLVFWNSMMVYGCLLKQLAISPFDDVQAQGRKGKILSGLTYLVDEYAVGVDESVLRQTRELAQKGIMRFHRNMKRLRDTLGASQSCLMITLKTMNLNGGVLQCPRCKTSPIYREQCGDLEAHHGNAESFQTYTDNRCPNPKCRYFGNSTELDWDKWDGFVRIDTDSVFPVLRCNSVEDCQFNMTKQGQKPPRPPCFPFEENGDACVDNFGSGSVRQGDIVRALLGMKRKRETFNHSLTLNIPEHNENAPFKIEISFNYACHILKNEILRLFGNPPFHNYRVEIFGHRDQESVELYSHTQTELALYFENVPISFENVLTEIPQSSFCKCAKLHERNGSVTHFLYESIESITSTVNSDNTTNFTIIILDVQNNSNIIYGDYFSDDNDDHMQLVFNRTVSQIVSRSFVLDLYNQETRYEEYFGRTEQTIADLRTLLDQLDYIVETF